jgi:phosphoribosyl 1,2-cyclic phosphodiesterase
MELRVISTGSKGNCYTLSNKHETLVLDAGVSPTELSCDVDMANVVGVLITHEHGDHGGFAIQFASRFIDCYSTQGTFSALLMKHNPFAKVLPDLTFTKIGSFNVCPITSHHDAAEPVNFIIQHNDFGILLYATDTYNLPFDYDANHLLIEANHDIPIIEDNVFSGKIDVKQANRIINSHMSIDNCCDFIARNRNDLRTVTLCHLSSRNSNSSDFAKRATDASGGIKASIAARGLKIQLF